MTTTLITGANKGLGSETARRLIAAGHTVYVGSRDTGRGRRAAAQLGARMILIDVTDDASAAAAAKTIEADGGLDLLVNNAGIAAVDNAADVTADLMQTMHDAETFVSNAKNLALSQGTRPGRSRARAVAPVRDSNRIPEGVTHGVPGHHDHPRS